MAICTIPGMALVLLAPGNQFRLKHENRTSLFEPSAVIEQFRRYWAVFNNENYNIINILIVIIIFEILVSLKRKKSLLRLLADNASIFSGIAGAMALSLMGFYSARPMMLGYVVFYAGAVKTVMTLPEYINELKGESLKEIIRLCLKTATAVLFVRAIQNINNEGLILWGICTLLTAAVAVVSKNVEISESNDLRRIKKVYGFIAGKAKYILSAAAAVVCMFIIIRLGNEFQIYRKNVSVYNNQLNEIVSSGIYDYNEFAEKYWLQYDTSGRLLPNSVQICWFGEFYISWYKKYYEYYVEPDSENTAYVIPMERCLSSQ